MRFAIELRYIFCFPLFSIGVYLVITDYMIDMGFIYIESDIETHSQSLAPFIGWFGFLERVWVARVREGGEESPNTH